MQDFADWLQAELDRRNWNKSDFSRASGLDTGFISNVLNRVRRPGEKFCQRTAKAFGLNEQDVFYQAGLLSKDPGGPTQKLSPWAMRIVALLENRPEAQQKAALSALEAFFDAIGEHEKTLPAKNKAVTTPQK